MFFDSAKINIKAGDGGNGIVSFRREKYVPEGGPNGGDGGHGGSVYFIADAGLRTLVDFKYRRHYKGERGAHGQGKNMHGHKGEDLYIKVPIGTIVKDDDTGEVLADFIEDGQTVKIAKGGRGGKGNARFMSNTNKAPRVAEKGEPGEEKWLKLELKLLADVGLIGMPNAGKSTLISKISAAKPKIADYPFTTLVPNLGVVSYEDTSFVVADIPGLIEGAHTGAGLGHDFLKHVERTRVLVHVVDISKAFDEIDPYEKFVAINKELELYNKDLAARPQIVVANKIELPGALENLEEFKEKLQGQELYQISAVTGEGIDKLLPRLVELLATIEEPEEPLEKAVVFKAKYPERFKVTVDEEGVYVISGREIEKHLAMTYLENEESLRRFQNIMKLMGVDDELRKQGAKAGDPVRIGKLYFDFVD